MKTDSQMPELTDNPKCTEDCTATVCKSCHTSLENAPVIGRERRQKFDIPAISMKVTEYRVEIRKCPKCEHKNHLNFPNWINQRTQYGHNVRRYAVYFNKYLRVPVKGTVETFQDIFGTTISESFIAETVENDGQFGDNEYCPEFIKDHKDIEIKLIEVKNCKKCGHSLEKATIMGYSRRQVFDIPITDIGVTEYQGKIRQCPNCKNRNQPNFPNSVTESIQYGDNVKSHAVYFNTYLNIPLKKSAKIFEDIFKHPISETYLRKITLPSSPPPPPIINTEPQSHNNSVVKQEDSSSEDIFKKYEEFKSQRVIEPVEPKTFCSKYTKSICFLMILLSVFPIIYYHIFKSAPIIFKEVDVEEELADIRGQIEKVDAEFRRIGLLDEEISELKADNLSTGYIQHFKCKVLGREISRYQILSFFDITRKGSVNLNAEGKIHKISVITGYNRDTSDIPADSEVDELLEKKIYDEDNLEDNLKRLYDINDHTNTLYFMDDICFRLVYDHPIKVPYEKYIKALTIKYVGSGIKEDSYSNTLFWKKGNFKLTLTERGGNSKTWSWGKGDFNYEISNPRAGIVRVKALHKTISSQFESILKKAQEKRNLEDLNRIDLFPKK